MGYNKDGSIFAYDCYDCNSANSCGLYFPDYPGDYHTLQDGDIVFVKGSLAPSYPINVPTFFCLQLQWSNF
jgi:hypothetical protein